MRVEDRLKIKIIKKLRFKTNTKVDCTINYNSPCDIMRLISILLIFLSIQYVTKKYYILKKLYIQAAVIEKFQVIIR